MAPGMASDRRPLCKCHGAPMTSHGVSGFRCSVTEGRGRRAYYARHHETQRARGARKSMLNRGDKGAWMRVLRVERVSEIEV